MLPSLPFSETVLQTDQRFRRCNSRSTTFKFQTVYPVYHSSPQDSKIHKLF